MEMSRFLYEFGSFFARVQFVTLPRCPEVRVMQITQLNVITEIPLDFSQKYQTVPRPPNRRATVYFGTQLISVGCIGPTKKSQCGPCQPSRFLPASPAFYATCPSKTFSRLAGLHLFKINVYFVNFVFTTVSTLPLSGVRSCFLAP